MQNDAISSTVEEEGSNFSSFSKAQSVPVISDYDNVDLKQTIASQKNEIELNLKLRNLTCQDMEIVACHLLNNTHYLSLALRSNNTLIILELSHNEIDEEGAQNLINVLKTNKTLETINLTWNEVPKKTLEKLATVLKSRI
ncbi:hypothetical protein I4U23_023491 [Adineta vaga]|nr:hypothetical protein I4U23_023491 [Adineta vaga]